MFWQDKKVVVLSGGVGGARLVAGLVQCLPSDNLTIVANTGDDFEHLTLWIAPDCDTLMYTLANKAPIDRGWGIQDDTFHTLHAAQELGATGWFLLGDQDMATHLLRTTRLRRGETLTAITTSFCDAMGIGPRILPMADSPHPTLIRDTTGNVHSFQDWLVRHRAEPVVQEVILQGDASTTDAVKVALHEADLIILPPSNPFVSLDPILRIGEIRTTLCQKPVIGVAPILAGKAVKGPLAHMIPALCHQEASAETLCHYYDDLLNVYVVHHGDFFVHERIAIHERDILMPTTDARVRLAQEVLDLAQSLLTTTGL